ncbi:hypothetical protein P691DRAFT_737060 [Macrolepiota fuliginosa MF-IS2]|uniref:Uncharacterized protein n=1 Tax=Macrolepiota fuliginosa MF-IS2 TaxID=1400762 RepID=A0A9P5X441_9AGAR|nr:hypothetical protein P691DRAFT_737060 [Macrolepiota fuliginosa MF-IS2]
MANVIPAHKEVTVLLTTSLAFGFSLCTLAHCLRWLVFPDEGWSLRGRINWTSLTVLFLIFALNVISLALTCWQLEEKVFHLESTQTDAKYRIPSWVEPTECASANFAALLADSILIHRCWRVYNRSIAIIAFPVTLWMGGAVCTALHMYLLVAQANGSGIDPYTLGPITAFGPGVVLLTFLASIAVLNAYSTSVLIHRIHEVMKQIEGSNSTKTFRHIIRILAESGFLYLSVTLGHFIAWLTANNIAIEALRTLSAPVVNIAFHLVIIRSARNRVERDETRKARRLSTIQFSPASMAGPILTVDEGRF